MLTFALQLHAANSTTVLTGRVLDVHDGDTMKVQLSSGPISVRLAGIDAPEVKQEHGPESTAALKNLVVGAVVDLQAAGQKSYDRMVAIVYVGDLNVNAQMVKLGAAWAARDYLRKRKDVDVCAYESAARALKRGLWAQPSSLWIEPGEWRNRKKRNYRYTDYSRETTVHCIAAIGRKK
jgi:endonuclease YncB( thermonuclease family)